MTEPIFNWPEEKESYEWVMKNIQGSTNQWHIDTCQVLIRLYQGKYNAPEASAGLLEALQERAHEIDLIFIYNAPLPFEIVTRY
jgi:hypothetical protein